MASPKNEVVIGVMGMTGVGKSTFIKTVTRNPDIVIGHSTLGETTKVTPYKFRHENRDFVLVDTPGFNDPIESDENVAKRILEWLKESYEEGTKMSGMVYLHNLSTPRVQGSVVNNLMMFQKLVGQKGFENVILAPTFWENMDPSKVDENIRELEQEKKFWKTMKAKGSKVMKLGRNRESGLEIIMTIAQKRPVILQAQEEMNNQHKAIEHTSARLVFDNFEDKDFDRTKKELLQPLTATAARRERRPSPSPVRYDDIEEDEGIKKLKAEREEELQRRRKQIADLQSRAQAVKEARVRYEAQNTRSSGEHSPNLGTSKKNGHRRSSGGCKCRVEGDPRCGECSRKITDVGKYYYHCCRCTHACYLRCELHGPWCDDWNHGRMERKKAGVKGLFAGLLGLG